MCLDAQCRWSSYYVTDTAARPQTHRLGWTGRRCYGSIPKTFTMRGEPISDLSSKESTIHQQLPSRLPLGASFSPETTWVEAIRKRLAKEPDRGNVPLPLCAGLPTPHAILTEGLLETPNELPLQETCGRTFRQGRETCAERGGTASL